LSLEETERPDLQEPAWFFDPEGRGSTTRGTRRFVGSDETAVLVTFGRVVLTRR
jgi:hypothetical protein